MPAVDLELLKTIFKDDRVHLTIAQVLALHMATDRSVLRLTVAVWPEQQEQVVHMAWDSVGPGAGFIQLPAVGDMCIIGQAYGDEEHGYVLKMLTSKEDPIPMEVDTGDLVGRSRPGMNARLISDTKIYLSRPGHTPTEPLVLGNVLKAMLSTVLDAVAAHTHIGNMGYKTSPPSNASVYTSQKASPVADGAMLSDLASTEK